MHPHDGNLGACTALEATFRLLKDLQLRIQQHNDALIRMNVNEIQEHLAAETSICKRLATLRPQLGPASTDFVKIALDLRRTLRTHSILLRRSSTSMTMLSNTSSADCGLYPQPTLGNSTSFINPEHSLA